MKIKTTTTNFKRLKNLLTLLGIFLFATQISAQTPTASAQTFCSGATVSNLVATGTALQWYDVATGGSALSTSTVLATGTYYVSQTVDGVESNRTSVVVTVNSTPTITTQPTSATFCEGTIASVPVIAQGNILTYQWQESTDNGSNWANVSYASGTTATLSSIVGVPLALNGYQFRVVVTNDSGCSVTSNVATLTVTPTSTITLTSAAFTDAQTVCANQAITPIIYSLTGATDATVSGLPNGVTASNSVVDQSQDAYNGGFGGSDLWQSFTAGQTGELSQIAIFKNGEVALEGFVKIYNGEGTSGTLVSSTPISSDISIVNQVLVPLSTPINVVAGNVYTFQVEAINNSNFSTVTQNNNPYSGGVSSLDTNVDLWFKTYVSNNTLTISGTPSVSGTFNYSIPLTGGCGSVDASGTITVNPLVTPTFTQVASICSGATLDALPTTSVEGITGSWSPAVYNTATTTYTFTPTAGQCATTATMTITVNTLNTITLTSSGGSNQSLCNPSDFASITYATTAATGATFSGLPAGVTGTWSNDVVTISGTPTVSGSFNYIVTLTGGCGSVTATGTIASYTTTWTVVNAIGSWSNGAPTASVGAIIAGDYAVATDLNACSLIVNNNAVVSVPTGFDFNIVGKVDVQSGSSLTFENNANLIQSGTTNMNSGEITSKRINTSMRRLDYTYWSSPTASSSYSLKMFSPMTISQIPFSPGGVTGTSRFYYLNEPTNALVNTFEPTTTYFDEANIARGWCIRAPNNFPTNGNTSTFNANWTGKPNSGNITIATPNSGVGKGSNLIGNPYPSAIDAISFLTYSPNGTDYPNAGTLYFWSHKAQGTGVTNYASCNLAGQTAPSAGGVAPNGTVQVGQAFLLKKAASSLAVFTNAMRVGNNAGQFFKTATAEKHRIWLNLATDTTPLNQMLVGYMEETTLGFDESYDGKQLNSGSTISSLISNENYVIQARPTPFANTDVVDLGFKADAAGSYTLSIDHVDGLFLGNQNIYLRDNLLNVTHDIKSSAYTFTSDQGIFNNRFDVVYTNSTLNISTPTFDANSVVVYKNDNKVLSINAGKVVMKNVKIYDVRGRLIYEKSNINTTTTALTDLKAEQEVLLVKITSDDNKVVTKKVVF
ncbi:T9SS sorting signal type C domain-containing protein [Flavobacterium sp.]|uniref:T9SS sorting signal type C domain-containing protein n=1 Tax=Flavobacterium sp. TaxID=239 RepID=UPI00248A7FA2|nr:T9SS sorting signal type C domain-containing protein [Flavobacterium sp.]MDI1315853.1 T9SS sorting signal type C domain-containing protein [Flavobacterium sp.]